MRSKLILQKIWLQESRTVRLLPSYNEKLVVSSGEFELFLIGSHCMWLILVEVDYREGVTVVERYVWRERGWE